MPRRPAVMTMEPPARQHELAALLATGFLRRQTQPSSSAEPAEGPSKSSRADLADGQ